MGTEYQGATTGGSLSRLLRWRGWEASVLEFLGLPFQTAGLLLCLADFRVLALLPRLAVRSSVVADSLLAAAAFSLSHTDILLQMAEHPTRKFCPGAGEFITA